MTPQQIKQFLIEEVQKARIFVVQNNKKETMIGCCIK